MGGPPFKERNSHTATFSKIIERGYRYVVKIHLNRTDSPFYDLMKTLDENPIEEELEKWGWTRGDFKKIEVYEIPPLVKVKDLDLEALCANCTRVLAT